MSVRTRFAPSPTGYLHIGGVRTALFSFLYARNQKGKFLLRIEDTDQQRSEKQFENEILESLQWLGLEWDEDIVRQSENLPRYQEVIQELLSKDLAYEETTDGKTAVKFRMPEKQAVFYDLVRDEVQFDTALFDDLVIQKSDGFPTFHLACVVDDHDMGMTHVIRGEDHLSNTPRQIMLYEAMGWKPPKFAHLPLIVGDDGSPLSKRHGKVSLPNYREDGFLPEGILNYLALLGWGAGDNQEFFTLEQMIKKFSLKKITKSSAKFDEDKFEWMNGQHIKQCSEKQLSEMLKSRYGSLYTQMSEGHWGLLVSLYHSRLRKITDLEIQASYLFQDTLDYDQETMESFMKEAPVVDLLNGWCEALDEFADFEDVEALETKTREVAASCERAAKVIIHPLRFAITSKTVSPSLFEVLKIVGKEKCLQRVRCFLKEGEARV